MFPIFFEQEHIPMMIFNRRDSARSGERMDVPSAMTTVGLVIPRACPDEGNISHSVCETRCTMDLGVLLR
jgi:hypothetical protein